MINLSFFFRKTHFACVRISCMPTHQCIVKADQIPFVGASLKSKALNQILYFIHALILTLSDLDRPFSVVCDASDFAINRQCAFAHRCVRTRTHYCLRSWQLTAAKRNFQFMTRNLLTTNIALSGSKCICLNLTFYDLYILGVFVPTRSFNATAA